ncbi:IS66 family insertion sequence element accessory protein TnpB [Terrarubrum flagellatum]
MSGPRLVSATARRHGVSRSLLVTWRRGLGIERRDSETTFVPAVIAGEEPATPLEAAPAVEHANAGASRLEIVLTNGRRVIVDTGVDVEALGRIVAVLDRR